VDKKEAIKTMTNNANNLKYGCADKTSIFKSLIAVLIKKG